MRILITGGAGYIGCHLALQLLNAKHEVLILDNFSRGLRSDLDSLSRLADDSFSTAVGNVLDEDYLRLQFRSWKPDTVVHLAALKPRPRVSERDFHLNNVFATAVLLKVMREFVCSSLIFASSAAVYGCGGIGGELSHEIESSLNPVTLYGRSKLIGERLCAEWAEGGTNSRAIVLRVFNPVGCHDSGLIGEPLRVSGCNVLTNIARANLGLVHSFSVFGDDFCTGDGSAVRDYLHVEDVAGAFALAIDKFFVPSGMKVLNVGSGKGTSVFEVVKRFTFAVGKSTPISIGRRRPGDVGCSIANIETISNLFNWVPTRDFSDACRSSLLRQSHASCQFIG